jgi:hypothetical protein
LPADFKLDFKDIVLSHPDELLGLPYVEENLKMSYFSFNLNFRNIPPVALDMVQIVHRGPL